MRCSSWTVQVDEPGPESMPVWKLLGRLSDSLLVSLLVTCHPRFSVCPGLLVQPGLLVSLSVSTWHSIKYGYAGSTFPLLSLTDLALHLIHEEYHSVFPSRCCDFLPWVSFRRQLFAGVIPLVAAKSVLECGRQRLRIRFLSLFFGVVAQPVNWLLPTAHVPVRLRCINLVPQYCK